MDLSQLIINLTIIIKANSTAASVDMQALLKDKETNTPAAQVQEGKEIEGTILGKGQSVVYLDLSPWGTGIIYKGELQGSPYDLKKLKIGEKLTAKVIAAENPDGFIELSLREIGDRRAWETLAKNFGDEITFPAKVMAANKGGLMVTCYGINGFLPASQLGPTNYPRVEDGNEERILMKLKDMIGQSLNVRVLDFSEADRKLILSEKAAEETGLKEALSKYKVGDVVEGDVSGIVDFGAFVKFDDSLEGLVHISELGWRLIDNPKEIVQMGNKIKAQIIGISGTQVSLSIKALQQNPWQDIAARYQVGQMYQGTVTKLNPFGAFVYLDKDIHGLAHISQFESEEKMQKALAVNEVYKFKITSMKPDQHRMSLKLIRPGDEAKEIAATAAAAEVAAAAPKKGVVRKKVVLPPEPEDKTLEAEPEKEVTKSE